MSWVCVLLVVYDDGTHDQRVIHRGTEDECQVVAGLVPASRVEFDASKLPPEVRKVAASAAMERIEIQHPPSKTVLHSVVTACHESSLGT